MNVARKGHESGDPNRRTNDTLRMSSSDDSFRRSAKQMESVQWRYELYLRGLNRSARAYRSVDTERSGSSEGSPRFETPRVNRNCVRRPSPNSADVWRAIEDHQPANETNVSDRELRIEQNCTGKWVFIPDEAPSEEAHGSTIRMPGRFGSMAYAEPDLRRLVASRTRPRTARDAANDNDTSGGIIGTLVTPWKPRNLMDLERTLARLRPNEGHIAPEIEEEPLFRQIAAPRVREVEFGSWCSIFPRRAFLFSPRISTDTDACERSVYFHPQNE